MPSDSNAASTPVHDVVTRSKLMRPGERWSIVAQLCYCAALLVHYGQADLPLYLGVLSGGGFLAVAWGLEWVRARASDRARHALTGVLTGIACACWGAALSPWCLLKLLPDHPEQWGWVLALGLSPWTVAWSIGGMEFRRWLADIRLPLALCAALTWLLFLVGPVFYFVPPLTMIVVLIMNLPNLIGLSAGGAVYLAILTGMLLTRMSAPVLAFLDNALVSGKLDRRRVAVLKGATVIGGLLLAFPPWAVQEQTGDPAGALTQRTPFEMPIDRGPFRGGRLHVQPGPIRLPVYAPPVMRYEPWYMYFYRKPPEASMGSDKYSPSPLGRTPQSDADRIYVRYVHPNRLLSLNLRVWLILPGLTVVVTAGTCLVLRGQMSRVQ